MYKWNGREYEVVEFKDIAETGLYKIVVNDFAGNATSLIFYVFKENDNKQVEVISISGNTSEEIALTYREIFMVRYDEKSQSIYYDEKAFGSILPTDGVHIIGVNADDNYIRLIKYNGKDLYNTVTNIKANAAGVSSSLIRVGDKVYLIMALAADDSGDLSQDDINNQANKGDQNKGNSFTWIFYILGVIGMLGGSFLIVKLRNKVRAA